MNLLALSFDQALVDRRAAAHKEALARQESYASELLRRSPGSRIWITVRATNRGQTMQQDLSVGALEIRAAPSSTAGFAYTAYSHGRSLFHRQGLDLVTTQSPFVDACVAWLLRKKCGVRFLTQLHLSTLDDPYWLREGPANRFRAQLGRWMLREADAVRVVSRAASTWVQEQLKVPSDRVFLIPVGSALIDEAGLPPRRPYHNKTVLFVGRLSPEKGLTTLLRAFAGVAERSARLLVAGDGPSRPALQALAGSLRVQERVEFLGWVSQGDLANLYRNAGVVVVPSLHESFGRVIVEAMSLGTPVVATDTQGARELIVDGLTGRVVPVNDVSALAQAIGDTLRNPERAFQMGLAARSHVREMLDPQALCAAQVDMWLKVAAT